MGAQKQNELAVYLKREEHLWDELECIKAEEECIHTPDMLEFLGMEQSNTGIVLHFKCSCGREIDTTADL